MIIGLIAGWNVIMFNYGDNEIKDWGDTKLDNIGHQSMHTTARLTWLVQKWIEITIEKNKSG